MKKLLLSLALVLPLYISAQQKDTAAIRFSKTITSADLGKHLRVLASDEYEGRETGKKGQKMAAKYISDRFREYGIPPLPNGTYYQEYPLEINHHPEVNLTINGTTYTALKDYYYFSNQPSGELNFSEVVFAGYGIADEKYNDYKGLKVEGKAVMTLSREPMGKDSISIITGKKSLSGWSSNFRKKAETAKEKGAAALLIVVDDSQVEGQVKALKRMFEHATASLIDEKGEKSNLTAVIYISESMANQIMKAKKTTATDLRKKISSKGKPVTFTAKSSIAINIKKNTEQIQAENVLGYIEGTDLKHELIVITAHYDHLGIEDGKVFNGADDDGSGTVGIMEIAEAFAKAKKEGKGPRRSVLFMGFSGEEKGLLGSRYYTDHPVFPLENTVTNLNIDMIGRLDEAHANDANYVYLIGSDMLSSELHQVSEQTSKTYAPEIKLDYTYNDVNDKNRYYYRSDHYNFAKNNIPVIFYFNGVHKDYHKETDEVEKIDFNKMEKITRLVFHTAWELANRNERVKVDKKENKGK